MGDGTMKFPVLFESADKASNMSQKKFLWLIRLEYFFLLLAAFFSLGLSDARPYYIGYAAVLLTSMALMAYRSLKKPEKTWYRARALAESVKTLTWRFAMRAEPFDDDRSADARRDFRALIWDVLNSNREMSEALGGLKATGDQLPNEMQTIREFALEDRKAFYLKNRVSDQRAWYEKKAASNKKAAQIWFWVSCVAYAMGLFFVITRIVDPSYVGWPTEPLVVVASAIVGWTQIKKFNELAAAYSLTAQEIGLTESLIADARTNAAFSAAVNEAELAFSREHTQWSARQHHGG
ncbi:DUF4231 domain-containing protein [Rhizobium rhizogenes]|uniref:DUF4231 domain-containing protein n=1 Tax=Rhizobium rhizogenes TaxID=359 RepID=A0AA88JST3_RHIRH|nr:DUF4231 domain-containing protein [Rhizobium rhizogenes]KAA3504563.1 DUF4231 domain-containing protein [Rhizobium rhizogenes]